MQAFAFDAARCVARLHQELRDGDYRPGAHRVFVLGKPKRRLISCAPVRDRVVHHALHRVLAPMLDAGHVHRAYAHLPRRGVQRAVLAFQATMRRQRWVRCSTCARSWA